jgi:hypothetical protein
MRQPGWENIIIRLTCHWENQRHCLIGFYEKGKLHAFSNRRSPFVSNWGSDIWDDGLEELEVEASPVLAELQLLSYGGDVLLSHKFEIDTRDIPAIKRL